MRARVDRGRGAGAVEEEELLAILGRVVGVEVGAPRGRDEAVRQPGVGEGRVAVRLDDVDRPRPAGGRAGREAEDVDHLAGLVVGDERAESGQRVGTETRAPLSIGPVLGRVATDRDDVVLRASARPERRVHPRLSSPVTMASPCAPPSSAMVVTTEARSGSMKVTPSAVATATRSDRYRRGCPGSVPSAMAASSAVRVSPDARVAEDDRRPGRRRVEARLVRRRRCRVEDVGEGSTPTAAWSVTSSTVAARARAAAARRQVGDVRRGRAMPRTCRSREVDGRRAIGRRGDHVGTVARSPTGG